MKLLEHAAHTVMGFIPDPDAHGTVNYDGYRIWYCENCLYLVRDMERDMVTLVKARSPMTAFRAARYGIVNHLNRRKFEINSYIEIETDETLYSAWIMEYKADYDETFVIGNKVGFKTHSEAAEWAAGKCWGDDVPDTCWE